jgi:ankyrin repeat protein
LDLIARGQFDRVQRAVQQGLIDPNARPSGTPLVYMAGGFNAVGLLRFLILECGVGPNQAVANGSTALHVAINHKHERAALFLIQEAPGVDIEARGHWGFTPLMVAAHKGLLTVMRELVARGADVSKRDETEHRMSALDVAIAQGHEDAAIYLLEEERAPLEASTDCRGVATAVWSGSGRIVRAIVRRWRADGIDAERMADVMTVMARYAIDLGHLSVLAALVAEGLDVGRAKVKCKGGQYGLLHVASYMGDLKAVSFLVERGCDPLAYNQGHMAHHRAATNGHLPVLQWLMTHCGVPVDAPMGPPNTGATALHVAATLGHMDMAQWLVGAGADPRRSAACPDGVVRRPSLIAAINEHTAASAFLLAEEQRLEAAEAAARAEQEAAARRARNQRERERRRAKARRRRQQQEQQEEAGADGGGAGDGQEQQQTEAGGAGGQHEEEEKEEDASLVAAVASLAVAVAGGASGDGSGEQEQEQGQGQQPEQPPEPATGAAAGPTATGGEEEATALAAAIALSLSAERPPPLEEYLDTHAPEHLLCPISLGLLHEPMVLMGDGCTYSRVLIEQHLELCRKRAWMDCLCVCVFRLCGVWVVCVGGWVGGSVGLLLILVWFVRGGGTGLDRTSDRWLTLYTLH